MARDIVYIYTAENEYKREELGEIQTNFNMSFVIDGTKDSSKMIVKSYVDYEIKPMSIINHPKTNTWWVVSHDKVERFPNETGYFYQHELELTGAIEYLNYKDLTDCGFNENKYTINSFLYRLFSLSSLDKSWTISISPENYDRENKVVDYIKTFENYTLLSAIREFLDGYNLCGKLSFIVSEINGEYQISGINLRIISKTGLINTFTNADVFNDVHEVVTCDKNSYGTTVISNAENVVSTMAKTYPTLGGAKFSSNEYNITAGNAIIRLPSDIFKVNYIQILYGMKIEFYDPITLTNSGTFIVRAFTNIKSFLDRIQNIILADGDTSTLNAFLNQRQSIEEELNKAGSITLYNFENYDPINNNFVIPQNIPNVKQIELSNGAMTIFEKLWLCDKQIGQSIARPDRAIQWERGRNYIENFNFISSNYTGINNLKYTDLNYDGNAYTFFEYNGYRIHISMISSGGVSPKVYQSIGFQSLFRINYIPMNDLKIILDNANYGGIAQLYNQNGKITDSVALSKLLVSYLKEIESNTITKNGIFYSFDDIPPIGTLIKYKNSDYVINNISLDFYENENIVNDINYYINAEITMSKYTSTKSLMTNPNTNIRDYGIPQNYNVKRKQVLRDFYELNVSKNSKSTNDWYLPLNRILNLYFKPTTISEHRVLIKTTWEEEGQDKNWYYQLDTISYVLKKSFYEVVNFGDNNIIGYDFQNSTTAIQPSNFLTGQYQAINTPISYVDENGNIRDLELLYMLTDELQENYEEYISSIATTSTESEYAHSLVPTRVFIPQEIYDSSLLNYDFKLTIENYNKDAIEVPFFEYSCQIDDSEDVVVGDNILDVNNDDYCYLYIFTQGDGYTQNSYIPLTNLLCVRNVDNNDYSVDDPYYNGYTIQTRAARVYYQNDKIIISIYSSITFNSDGTIVYGTKQDIRDFGLTGVVSRVTINRSTKLYGTSSYASVEYTKHDIMFIIKNSENAVVEDGSLVLTINHYKV